MGLPATLVPNGRDRGAGWVLTVLWLLPPASGGDYPWLRWSCSLGQVLAEAFTAAAEAAADRVFRDAEALGDLAGGQRLPVVQLECLAQLVREVGEAQAERGEHAAAV